MPIKNNITDGTGSGTRAKVNTEHALLVSVVPNDVPVTGTPNRYRYFVQDLQNDSGSSDMAVDGSVTPQEFSIYSNLEYDIHITKIEVLVADGTVSLSKFGAINELTNGLDMYVVEEGDITYLIDSAKTNGRLILQSGGTNYVTLTNYLSNSDGLMVIYNIKSYLEEGLRIGRASENRITAVVNDDLTDLDEMFIRVFGYKNYPTAEQE